MDFTIRFPIKGQSELLGAETQEPQTSPAMMNCIPFDVEEQRARGGKREGTIKLYETQVGGAYPIVEICGITTIYIPPE